ncbi:hypothetical protein THOM_3174 [Trachipleistophora hominis]|uniref:Uncharacterized protein n=1 Tax=Trachipleistophora hominis TaxID=72359 RepID=L7JS72_TRAHO|nr:hypothetical protein THOM_3174 [Trachipleistophora hominis]
MNFLHIVIFALYKMINTSSAESESNPIQAISTEAFLPLDLLTPDMEKVIKVVVSNTTAVDDELKKRIMVRLEQMNEELDKITTDEMVKIRSILEKNQNIFYDGVVKDYTGFIEKINEVEPLLKNILDLNVLAEGIKSSAYTLIEQSHERKLVNYSTLFLTKNTEAYVILKNVLEQLDSLESIVLHFHPTNEKDIERIAINNDQLNEDITKAVNAIVNEFITENINNASRKNRKTVEAYIKHVIELKDYILNKMLSRITELSTWENKEVLKVVAEGNTSIRQLINDNMNMLTNLIKQIISNLSDEGLGNVKEMISSVNKDFLQKILPGLL